MQEMTSSSFRGTKIKINRDATIDGRCGRRMKNDLRPTLWWSVEPAASVPSPCPIGNASAFTVKCGRPIKLKTQLAKRLLNWPDGQAAGIKEMNFNIYQQEGKSAKLQLATWDGGLREVWQ